MVSKLVFNVCNRLIAAPCGWCFLSFVLQPQGTQARWGEEDATINRSLSCEQCSTKNVFQRRLSENVRKCKLRSHNTAVKKTCLYVGFACLHWTKQRRHNAAVRITEKHSHLEQAVFGTPFLISKGVGQHVTHLQTSSDRAQWIDLIKYDTFVTDYPTQQYTVVKISNQHDIIMVLMH